MTENLEFLRRAERRRVVAVGALLAGAVAIGASALFVKVSETGPVATAFWRVALALPFLWAWSTIEQRVNRPTVSAADWRLLAVCGLFFAGDLAVWHWSIVLTSVANATLLANLAPIFVTLAVWVLFRKQPAAAFLDGLATALAGVAMLLGGDLHLGGQELLGDGSEWSRRCSTAPTSSRSRRCARAWRLRPSWPGAGSSPPRCYCRSPSSPATSCSRIP